jgi:hypothetical protein
MERRIIQVHEKLPLAQTIPLSLQHLFAMFGATVLVPFLFKVNPATSILMNGIGTLIYLIVCQRGEFPLIWVPVSHLFLLFLPFGRPQSGRICCRPRRIHHVRHVFYCRFPIGPGGRNPLD